MIERIFLDGDGSPLLNCYRMTKEQALFVRAEDLPEVRPVGGVEEVAGTGVKVYAGPELLTSGEYTISLGTHGKTHGDAFSLQREVMRWAIRARAVLRTGGGVLHLAHFTSIKRSFKGSAMLGGQVDVTFAPATPFWIVAERVQEVSSVGPTAVFVDGQMRSALRLTLTATSTVTNPSILSDAGLTTWLGTLQPGETLLIDGRPGHWAVTVNGADKALQLTGPQPYLEPGSRTLTLSAPNCTALIEWKEGEL